MMASGNRNLLKLMRQAKRGDETALEQLCDRFWPLIRKHVQAAPANDRQDTRNELMLELWAAVQRFEQM